MANKTDPFTMTPGIAGKAYIDNGIADSIIRNFCSDDSAKYVYKITGLRGSGKSVEYSRIIRTLRDTEGWLVYPLSASGDAVQTLISKLSMEKFISSKKVTTSVNTTTAVTGNAVIVSGNETVSYSRSTSENELFYSSEATLTQMVNIANKEKHS